MKKLFFTSLILFAAATAGLSQSSNDEAAITKIVHKFAMYADQQDTDKMDKILDDHFRSVVNQLFGSKEVSTMDKSTYLQMLSDKKIGGDKRQVSVLKVDQTANNAMVLARFSGKELHFTTYILLVKDVNGQWKIVNDMPHIEKA
ncbi:MAG: hypothetical protein DWQ02_02405 [Bacteroidetes bacterium]|nr:MAG: hypothetical protein DWQ02_02405 [Bacteroidota bacterium]